MSYFGSSQSLRMSLRAICSCSCPDLSACLFTWLGCRAVGPSQQVALPQPSERWSELGDVGAWARRRRGGLKSSRWCWHHETTEYEIVRFVKSCVHNKHFRGLVYMHAFTTRNAHHHRYCPEWQNTRAGTSFACLYMHLVWVHIMTKDEQHFIFKMSRSMTVD